MHEYIKAFLQFSHAIEDLNLINEFFNIMIAIFENNSGCVCWSQNITKNGLHHIQLRENKYVSLSIVTLY